MKKTDRRKERAKAETLQAVTPPPRAVMSEHVKKKLLEGKPLTAEENRLLVFALPRKARRANKVRTTGIREEIRALTSIIRGPEPVGAKSTFVRRRQTPRKTVEDRDIDLCVLDRQRDARRLTAELRKNRDAARRARFDAARKKP